MRVLAPDLRGFGESGKPTTVGEYAVSRSVADMTALLDAVGVERADVVGHDWGASVAWVLAAFSPTRVDRLVVLSVGHPNTFREPSLEQRERSWYQLLFQFAGVSETMLQHDDWRLLRELCRGDGDVDDNIARLARPGALTAALNWYRANTAPEDELELEARPPVPAVGAATTGIWSSGDNYLTEDSMLSSADHVTGRWRYERIEGASHWMQLDAADRVNALLLESLA